MNEQNLDYLNRQIKFTGFGEGHDKDLRAKMETGESEFTLAYIQEFGKDSAAATLHFRKAEATDLYYFNRYDLLVKNGEQPDPVRHTFYINPKEDHITFKEGYNLLSGRAIQKDYKPKEGEKYKAWLQLDFKETDKNGQYKIKQFHPNYGFDLEATIHRHPIKELSTVEGTKRLLESLERGNRQQVTYGEPGNEQKVFIEASPQFKSINFLDDSMRRIIANSLKKKPEESESQKQIQSEQTVSLSPANKELAVKPALKNGKESPKKQKRQKMNR
jgi:hypothetical protein